MTLIDTGLCIAILLKNLRSSFESLRARPELDEGTNGSTIEIIEDFSVLLSLPKYEPVEAFLARIIHRTRKVNDRVSIGVEPRIRADAEFQIADFRFHI